MKTRFAFRLLMLLAIIVGISYATPVLAGDKGPHDPSYNKTKEVRPDLGGQNEKGIVGENGFKVFNPGSIAVALVAPLAQGNLPSMAAATVYRSGSTDAWLSWAPMPPGWDHFGGHTSGSDLWENEIWVNGYLKITTDSGWRTSCSNHVSGNSAYCTTTFFQLIPRTIKAQTNHHFHTSGYVDQNFTTSDSA